MYVVCMLGVARFGVQGLEDGRARLPDIIHDDIYIYMALHSHDLRCF